MTSHSVSARDPALKRSTVSRPAPLLGFFFLLLTCGFVPLWVIASTDTDGYSAWVGALAAAIIAGARYSWVIASAQRRLFEMTTWLYFYLFLGIAPMVQLRERYDTSTTPNIDHGNDWASVTIVIAASISLILGSTLARRRSEGEYPSRLPARIVDRKRTALYSSALVVGSIAYVALVGVSTLFNNRADRGTQLGAIFSDEIVRAIVGAFVSMGLLVAVVAQLHIRRQDRLGDRRGAVVLLTISLLLLLLIVNPIGSPRYVVGVVALGLLAAFGVYRTVFGFRMVALGALVGMVVLFPLLDTFRANSSAIVESVSPLEALKSGDFDSFAQINNTLWFVNTEGYTFGRQLLGVLLFWVPRSLWPDKPLDTGVLLAEAKGYYFTNLSAPLPAELFINGGWLAVIVGMGLFGFMLRRWDGNSEAQLLAFGVPSVLGCVVPFYLLLLLRGSLLQSMTNLSVILISWFIVTRPRKKQLPEATAHKTEPAGKRNE